jgi:6-phosphogluconate dehydrogenase
MIHNGIEYGLMQAYAEGFELMHESPYKIDLGAVAGLWNHGSVVRSWLLELAARALATDADLSGVKGYVDDSGEGRWTLHEGIDRGVPLPVMTAALYTRFRFAPGQSFCRAPAGRAARPVRRPRRQDHVVTIVIFGGNGDLAHRKLLPALYNLHVDALLPPRTAIVGVAARN